MAPALLDHIVPLGKHSPVRGGGLGLGETCTRSAPTPTRAGAEVDRGPASGALGRECLGLEQWVLARLCPWPGCARQAQTLSDGAAGCGQLDWDLGPSPSFCPLSAGTGEALSAQRPPPRAEGPKCLISVDLLFPRTKPREAEPLRRSVCRGGRPPRPHPPSPPQQGLCRWAGASPRVSR